MRGCPYFQMRQVFSDKAKDEVIEGQKVGRIGWAYPWCNKYNYQIRQGQCRNCEVGAKMVLKKNGV